MALKRILTTAQREKLLSVEHLSTDEFHAYFSFSSYDLEIINQHRGDINKLGFALQLCLARYPDCSLSSWIQSNRLVSYIKDQLNLNTLDLALYSNRNTRANHFNEILSTFNYKKFINDEIQEKLKVYLIDQALENDDAIYLMKKALDFLSRNRVIFPFISTLEDTIGYCRDQAENIIFSISLWIFSTILFFKIIYFSSLTIFSLAK
ncbi:DUF4158 domain-containing protein [Lactococcus lactis subsp. lactis]|nr:DUF4158 domain-containing protein [Lactococcus lactis subsp. lactis]